MQNAKVYELNHANYLKLDSDKIINAQNRALTSYEENGCLMLRSLLSKEYCLNIKHAIHQLEPTIYLPGTSLPWGFGNLIDDSLFELLLNNQLLTDLIKSIVGNQYVYNHLMVNNKMRWMSPPVEWHQEMSNINTYAPGYLQDGNSWEELLQIYVAIDEHTVENGCLMGFPGSHRMGLLEHEDMVNSFYNHKRRITYHAMDRLQSQINVRYLLMKPGDVLLFSHRFVHGSSANNSPFDRMSLVIQARKEYQRSETIFEDDSKYRVNYIDSFFRGRVDLNSLSKYNSFVKKSVDI